MSSRTVPSPLYKYLCPQYARELMSSGSIKVGTLSEYRGMEGTDRERGDVDEGRQTLQSPASRNTYGGHKLPPVLRTPAVHIGPGGLVTDGLGAITIESQVRDLFIYCTTEVYDPDYGARFGKGELVACVRIDHPQAFFSTINTALHLSMVFEGVSLKEPRWGRCVYEGHRHNWEREDLPAPWLMKADKFEGQREVRVWWAPQPMQSLKFRILKVPELSKYCTVLSTSTL
jgi:hypothetical protein